MGCVGRTLLSAAFGLDFDAFDSWYEHNFDLLSGPHFSQKTREIGHPQTLETPRVAPLLLSFRL